MESKRVLIIAYEFPPSAAGGVIRTHKLCKYLPRYGWEPHVLAPRSSTVLSRDPLLLEELPSVEHVHRCRGLEYEPFLKRLRAARTCGPLCRAAEWRLRRVLERWALPDAKAYWAVPAEHAARRIIRTYNIDALYSTSWPFSDHLAGLHLHRQTGLPWIADFRDPWLSHYNYGPRGTWRDQWNRRLDLSICQQASFVVNTTLEATEDLRAAHVEMDPRKFVTVFNGFDAEDFAGEVTPDQELSIVHTGTFYGSRNPDGFLAGLEQFLRCRPEAVSHIRVRFLGTSLDRTHTWPCSIPCVESMAWSSHRDSVNEMRRARVLLMIQHREPAVRLTVTGKLYEYMATGSHILALNTHRGQNTEFLQRYGNATILHDDDPAHVAEVLESIHDRYIAGDLLPRPRPQFLGHYTREKSAEVMASLFDAAIAAGNRGSRRVTHCEAGLSRDVTLTHDTPIEEIVPCIS